MKRQLSCQGAPNHKRRWKLHIHLWWSILIMLSFLTACANGNSSPAAQTTPMSPTGTAATQPTVGKTSTPAGVTPTPTPTSSSNGAISHYEYVFPDEKMYVYNMDAGHALVKQVDLPTSAGVRGVVASPATHMLYVSYGGDGDGNGNGSLLKYDLLSDTVVWTKNYSHGIDSMAITPDGKTIYMPDGELTNDGLWYLIDAATGNETGVTIDGGLGPHNTIVNQNGKHVYMDGRHSYYLEVADTATNQVIKKVGPLQNTVRPFTINGAETLAYISITGFLGFQVGDLVTGKVLYTVPIQGFSWNGQGVTDPSHGISLSPDEKELYVIDSPNSYVHVFDVSNVPASAPRQVADIPVTSMDGSEANCVYDCEKDGWLHHSLDGRFVYVGDSGAVIDTATRKVVTTLPALANTRKMLEIDWQNGQVIATSTRSGVGYVNPTTSIGSPIPPLNALTSQWANVLTLPGIRDAAQRDRSVGINSPRH